MTQTDLVYTPSKEGFSSQCDRDLAQKRARLFTLQTAVFHRRIRCMRTFNRNGMSLNVSQGGPVVDRVFKAADRGLVVA